MTKHIAVGTTAFVVLSVVLGIAVQAAADLLGASPLLAGQVAMFLVAIPLALMLSRRVGRITHLSVLAGSMLLAAASLWAIVIILNAVAEPAGGHVGWGHLLNAMNWRNTLLGTTATLLMPQIWLLLINRMAANNSFKPKPLRGSA